VLEPPHVLIEMAVPTTGGATGERVGTDVNTRLNQHPVTLFVMKPLFATGWVTDWTTVTTPSFYQVYQQDATLYSILYYCQCCTCFRPFLRPSSGAQNCTRSIWYMSSLLAATASVGELEQPTHASGSSKQALHVPDAVCTVLSSWWAEKPPETCRVLTVTKNIV
jgi:hypothetical protein